MYETSLTQHIDARVCCAFYLERLFYWIYNKKGTGVFRKKKLPIKQRLSFFFSRVVLEEGEKVVQTNKSTDKDLALSLNLGFHRLKQSLYFGLLRKPQTAQQFMRAI